MSDDTGLIAAYILDGKGEGKKIGWEEIKNWILNCGSGQTNFGLQMGFFLIEDTLLIRNLEMQMFAYLSNNATCILKPVKRILVLSHLSHHRI